ncbi:MAG: hypothetical protein CL845_08355 [Crocinitomicaceae bacterium]|nr:hypothetical protein [Crocinitomicaceae bacterium]|tara:strand:+ start:191 stop:703 length:513 start_codon:yes stop_codon:yes gene_type:complete
MNAEEFDQYVRTQFETEAAEPPAELENIIFASLAAETRKRRTFIGVTACIGLAAFAAAVRLNDTAPAQPEVLDTAPVEVLAPAAINAEESLAPSVNVVDSFVLEQREVVNRSESVSVIPFEEVQKAPEMMEEVESGALPNLGYLDTNVQPEIQQLNREKWVLPATVKVND